MYPSLFPVPDPVPIPGCLGYPGTVIRWLTLFMGVEPEKIKGCSAEEIAHVESVAGKALPLTYKQWLSEAGREIGRQTELIETIRRSYMMYPSVLKVTEIARGVIEECGADPSQLEWVFPFYNWEVDFIYALDLRTDVDDPPVVSLDSASGMFSPAYPTLSCFIGYKLIFQWLDFMALNGQLHFGGCQRGHP